MPVSRPWLARLSIKSLWNPSLIFWVVGLLVGMGYCAAIPYGAGFDEEAHMVRIWDIANFNALPNHSKSDDTNTFRAFLDLSYQRRSFQSPAFDLFQPDKFLLQPDLKHPFFIQTRSVYPPVIFLPQAAAVKIAWRILHLPLLPGILLARMAGMLVYLLAGYVTIRLLPFGKWVFLLLALAPSALFQAATLNADGYTNAVSFLLIGLALRMYADPRMAGSRWALWALAGLGLLLGLAKPGYAVLLPVMLLLVGRRLPARRAWLIPAGGAALAVAAMIGWTVISVPRSHFAADGSQDLGRQLGEILANPGNFAVAYVNGAIDSLPNLYRDWVGVYGYWVGEVPAPVYLLYPLGLLAAALAEPRRKHIRWQARLFLLALFLVSAGAILFMYFYLHYSPEESTIIGRQGRYFIPMAPLLLLALTSLVSIPAKVRGWASGLAVGLLLVTLGLYSLGLYASYYTECGYASFAGQSCVLPIYKNLEKGSPPVVKASADATIQQDFISHCGEVEIGAGAGEIRTRAGRAAL